MTTIPLAPSLLAGSSDRPGGTDGPSDSPPYLVLLRAGFGLPPVLPRARCALTAPFHPYPKKGCDPISDPEKGSYPFFGRYVFCATFLQVTLTGRYPAHCPAEFGLSSPARTSLRRSPRAKRPGAQANGYARQRSSGQLQHVILSCRPRFAQEDRSLRSREAARWHSPEGRAFARGAARWRSRDVSPALISLISRPCFQEGRRGRCVAVFRHA